jgi:hypothetical protein
MSTHHGIRTCAGFFAWLVPAYLLYCLPASAACPAGEVELLPNIRALPPSAIAMLTASSMKFSATSWNPGDAKLELIARNPQTDPVTGQVKQPVDQRIYCSGGGYYDRPAGNAEYHPEHNHVHYNDYANYILEPADGSNQQNPRQGSKTTFCIMDTTSVNTQLQGASASAVFDWCPTQDPSFNTQGMSVGWGDTYGSNLPGQSLLIGDLAAGMYRLRHVFDPKNLLKEKAEDDNESCKLVEIGDGSNGRYVADRGPCDPSPQPTISSIVPRSAQHGTCVSVTVTGANLAPELRLSLSGGTGPLPSAKATAFDTAGNYVTAILCVPKAKGGGRNPKLGSDPVWDVALQSFYTGTNTNVLTNTFTVTP